MDRYSQDGCEERGDRSKCRECKGKEQRLCAATGKPPWQDEVSSASPLWNESVLPSPALALAFPSFPFPPPLLLCLSDPISVKLFFPPSLLILLLQPCYFPDSILSIDFLLTLKAYSPNSYIS